MPLLVAGICRNRDTGPQSEETRAARLRLDASAFTVKRDLTGMRIAIVDDVMTTGATVNALAARLRAAGADRVDAWAVARSVGRENPAAQSIRNR